MLIEPSRDYERLIEKNRKAKSLNVCLATKTVPHVVDFYNYDMVGGIKGALILAFFFDFITFSMIKYSNSFTKIIISVYPRSGFWMGQVRGRKQGKGYQGNLSSFIYNTIISWESHG